MRFIIKRVWFISVLVIFTVFIFKTLVNSKAVLLNVGFFLRLLWSKVNYLLVFYAPRGGLGMEFLGAYFDIPGLRD